MITSRVEGVFSAMTTNNWYGMVLAAASVLVAQTASAGCNCGVPPAPMASMGQPQWGRQPMYSPPMYGQSPWMSPTPLTEMSPQPAYSSPGGYSGSAVGMAGPHWAPGGYEGRTGSPVYYHDPAGGQYVVTGNPYYDHFGPGFHRDSLYGHYRFPYYNYRAPWAFPGRAVYNRDTNLAW